jgi:hypothetical protein
MRSINVAGRFSDRRKRMLAQKIDVERIEWPRPRQSVIALVGEQNQSLPLLVLAEGNGSPHQTGTYEGRAFISEKDKILAALSERHNFPLPHPRLNVSMSPAVDLSDRRLNRAFASSPPDARQS